MKSDLKNGNNERDINGDEREENGDNMAKKKTSLSKDAQRVAIVALGFIFAVYSFFVCDLISSSKSFRHSANTQDINITLQRSILIQS